MAPLSKCRKLQSFQFRQVEKGEVKLSIRISLNFSQNQGLASSAYYSQIPTSDGSLNPMPNLWFNPNGLRVWPSLLPAVWLVNKIHRLYYISTSR